MKFISLLTLVIFIAPSFTSTSWKEKAKNSFSIIETKMKESLPEDKHIFIESTICTTNKFLEKAPEELKHITLLSDQFNINDLKTIKKFGKTFFKSIAFSYKQYNDKYYEIAETIKNMLITWQRLYALLLEKKIQELEQEKHQQKNTSEQKNMANEISETKE